MAEPTSRYSFYDLILKVAKEAGVAYYGSSGNESPMIPVDYHDFEVCKKIVNDGIKQFIADSPPKGWRWMRRKMSVTLTATRTTGTIDSIPTANQVTDATLEDTYDSDGDLNNYWCYILTGTGAGSYAKITDYTASGGTFVVSDWLDEYGNAGGTDPVANDTFAITAVETVGGDIARYPLPEDFGGEVNGRIEYEKDSAHGTHIEWCDESLIRSRRSVTEQSGYPKLAAIRQLEHKSGGFGPKRRFELLINPKPSASEVLEFPYSLYFDELRIASGIADGGGATYITDTNRNEYIDYFNNWTAYIISGSAKKAYAIVTDYDSREGTATCTDGTSKINVASTAHGMETGDIVTVSGTTDYNGTWTITRVDDDNFTFVDTYTSDQSGVWKQRQIEVADWLTNTGVSAGIDPDSTSAYYIEPQANLHPAGYRFDDAIMAACLAKAEMEFEDMAGNYVQDYRSRALPSAKTLDTRSAPRTLGSMDRNKRYRKERTWNDVTTDNDI